MDRQRQYSDHQRRLCSRSDYTLKHPGRRRSTNGRRSRRLSSTSKRAICWFKSIRRTMRRRSHRQRLRSPAAQAALDNLDNQVELQYATIAQAEAQRASAEAREVEAGQEQDRQQSLTKTEAGTRQKLEQATADYAKAQADVKREPSGHRGPTSSARGAGRHQETASCGFAGRTGACWPQPAFVLATPKSLHPSMA